MFNIFDTPSPDKLKYDDMIEKVANNDETLHTLKLQSFIALQKILSNRFTTDSGEPLAISDNFTEIRNNAQMTLERYNNLAEALIRNTHLTKLVIEDEDLDSQKFEILVNSLRNNTTLHELSFGHKTCVGDDEMNLLKDVLEVNTTIRILGLNFDNKLTENGCQIIQEILTKTNSLKEIKFSLSIYGGGMDVSFYDKFFQYLAKGLEKNNSLTGIDLSGYAFNKKNSKCLFKSLEKNTTLKSIRLGFLGIESNYESLSDSLAINNSITDLKITGSINNEDENDFSYISKIVEKNKTLKTIYIDTYGSMLPMKKGETKNFIDKLKGNISLTKFDLVENTFSYQERNLINKIIKRNQERPLRKEELKTVSYCLAQKGIWMPMELKAIIWNCLIRVI